VLLIACTNTPGGLPPALLRRGRLGVTIPFQAPDLAGKTLLLKHYATRLSTAGPIDYGCIAGLFDEAAPASAIEEAVVEAWRAAVRRSLAVDGRPALGHEDLRVAALDHTLGACSYRRCSPAALLRTAVHEVGHALTALAYGIPVRLLSVRPNATRLGLTSTSNPSDDPGTTEEGSARLRICLGGMLAEIEAGLGQGGGSGADLASATQLAAHLVGAHGLGRRVGYFDPSALGGPSAARSHPAVSEWLLARVDQDAADLLQVAAGDVRALLADIGGQELLALGERLAEQETLDGREFEAAVHDMLGRIPALPAAR
jgi:cell division protease FtsH